MRFTTREIFLYAAFFLGVFAVFMSIAYYAYLHPRGHSIDLVAYWEDYEDGIGQVMVTKTSLSFYMNQGGMKSYRAEGHWSGKAFYAPPADGGLDDVLVARELPNEDLQIDMRYFNSNDTRRLNCVLALRGPEIRHPYPLRTRNDAVSYPPPKGLIQPGMLESDVQMLPWQPYAKETPPEVALQEADYGSYNGSKVMNNWPSIWKYKSDNSRLPELQVRIENGRVTQVEGGAEDTTGPSYIPNSDASTAGDSGQSPDAGQESWAARLFKLLFEK